MKALSLSRPWPTAILHHGKRIENRSDKRGMPPMCKYRGPLLLHAAQSWDSGCWKWAWGKDFSNEVVSQLMDDTKRQHPAGGIVGRCNVVGHIEPNGVGHDLRTIVVRSQHDEDWRPLAPEERRWWMGGYGLVLADVEPLPFVPCKGALGLWTVPPDVLARIA